MKKEIKYSFFTVSMPKEDIAIIKLLKDKYSINISSFFREKAKELLEKLQKK